MFNYHEHCPPFCTPQHLSNQSVKRTLGIHLKQLICQTKLKKVFVQYDRALFDDPLQRQVCIALRNICGSVSRDFVVFNSA